MSFAPKEGSFVLFKNEKLKSEKTPHYKGTIVKGGVKHDLLMWDKVSKNGLPFYSGYIGDVAQPPKSTAKPEYEAQRQQSKPIMDDEIPW